MRPRWFKKRAEGFRLTLNIRKLKWRSQHCDNGSKEQLSRGFTQADALEAFGASRLQSENWW
ncbi:hypothetical protein PAECIP111892_02410 [Paenibacillus auburnensis]|uniref:Uncharacterized protein n=1 Tax=Paenibacillus auburnensis TaxID=2905649 RepID=A0ABN8GA89_9BACL|nr:hypothetical protein PAECIP111892_02410 [Paenibacillus auburnensis]